MAASTSVYSTTPLAGIKLSFVGSTPNQAALTTCFGTDGHTYRLGKCASAVGSITTVKIGTAGSINPDSGSAGFTANAPGGGAIGQYIWAKKTTL